MRPSRFFVSLALTGALVACEEGSDPLVGGPPPVDVVAGSADPLRVDTGLRPVATRRVARSGGTTEIELVQVGFVQKPAGLAGAAGATSTSYYPGRSAGLFATVYNTGGATVGGAISTMEVKKGKLKVDRDVSTTAMEFAEARMMEPGNASDVFLVASGSAALDGSLQLTSEAIVVGTDLKKEFNVFDLPSGWAMGFDFVDGGRIVVGTSPTGSLSTLDPTDASGAVSTLLDGQPGFLGLATDGGLTYVTDESGSVRAFDAAGAAVGRWPLAVPFLNVERAEIGVCGGTMVVGGHGNGVLLMGDVNVTASREFGIGASILPDCSAFAATTDGGVVIGLAGESGYELHELAQMSGRPLPYANSVEILRIPGGDKMLGGEWTARDGAMTLLVLSSADGTHFIELRRGDD